MDGCSGKGYAARLVCHKQRTSHSSALKCPPGFSVHSVSKQVVLSKISQGVNTTSFLD